MGTTKIYPYSNQTLQLAQIAKALGHPARITILKYLFENKIATNDIFQGLQLSTNPRFPSMSKN